MEDQEREAKERAKIREEAASGSTTPDKELSKGEEKMQPTPPESVAEGWEKASASSALNDDASIASPTVSKEAQPVN
jgi:hypothetical protein